MRSRFLVITGLLALCLGVPATLEAGSSSARPTSRPLNCSAYPRPGSISGGGTPSDLVAEYGVLRRPRRPVDVLSRSELDASISASSVVLRGARFLGRSGDGARLYLVPARHLLAFRLAPPRCLPPSQRALERSLRPSLRLEYPHQALCLIVVRERQSSPTCQQAPGTVDPMLYTQGSPGLGLVPDGVTGVIIQFPSGSSRHVAVHDNLWIVNSRSLASTPCALQWVDATGVVLRTVLSCTRDTS